MRTLPFKSVLLLALVGLGGLASCSKSQYAQSSESDDLYFSSKDRKVAKYTTSTDIAAAQSTTNQRNVNPDYLSQYNQQSQQYNQSQDQDANDTYYDPNYENSDVIYADNSTLARRRTTSYGYSGIYPSYANNYSNYYGYNNYGNSWYDPYYYGNSGWNPYYTNYYSRWNPYWNSGWYGPGVSVSFGWGRWNRWNNWGWNDPYWGSYSAWGYGYDPYWGGGWYSPYSYSYGWYGGGWGSRNVWVNNYYYGNSRPGNSGSYDNGRGSRYGSRSERSTEMVNRNVDNSPRTTPRGGRVDAGQSGNQPAYSTRSSAAYGSRDNVTGDNSTRSGARSSEYTSNRGGDYTQPVRPRGIESRNYGSRSADANSSYNYRSSEYSRGRGSDSWSNSGSGSGYSTPQRSSGYGSSNRGSYSNSTPSTPQYSEPSRSSRSSSSGWGSSNSSNSNSGSSWGGGSRSSGSSSSGSSSPSSGSSNGGRSSGGGVRPR